MFILFTVELPKIETSFVSSTNGLWVTDDPPTQIVSGLISETSKAACPLISGKGTETVFFADRSVAPFDCSTNDNPKRSSSEEDDDDDGNEDDSVNDSTGSSFWIAFACSLSRTSSIKLSELTDFSVPELLSSDIWEEKWKNTRT